MRNSFLALLLFALISNCNRGVDQGTEYQKAFAKTYGYVKYFHPSDEASSIDWGKFAVYGAEQMEKCKSDEELIETLKTIFEPIAPSIKFYKGGEMANYDFQKITPEDTASYDLAYWQHKGVSVGMSNNGRPYSSIRVNREFEIDNSSPFGNIMTSIDASKYGGKEFKYSGWVKLEKSSSGTGSLWFRVDKSDGTMGFFDNMGSSPITENKWQQYEITGIIDSTASKLAFGCFLNGKGKLLLDDIKLDFKEGDNWMPVPLANSDFEGEEITFQDQWRHSGNGYAFNVSEVDKSQGERSATILSEADITKGMGVALFDQHPKFGELIDKQIGQNLFCQIPLVLYCKDENTYPRSTEEDLLALKNGIEKTNVENTELALRLGNVVNVYNVFQHFYPYFDVVDVKWEKELEKALSRSYRDSTERDHLTTLQKFTSSLKDGHIRVSSSNSETFVPPFSWEWLEDKLIITDVYDKIANLKVGDEITHVNGEAAKDYFNEIHTRISAATKGWLNYRARGESILGPKDSKITITSNGKNITLTRDRDLFKEGRPSKTQKPLFKKINDSVFYIDLDKTPMDTINKLIPEIEKCKAIIFDLRGYPKGNDGVISHLLKSKDTTQGWMKVPQIIYPDQEKVIGWESYEWGVETASPYLGDKQIIFITDGRAISYAESFMGYIEGYGLGTIVGQPTAGTNGNINPFKLPGGYGLNWTGMRVTKHDGSQHHAIGVLPDIYVTKTIEGVKAGKDEFLEKALELTEQ